MPNLNIGDFVITNMFFNDKQTGIIVAMENANETLGNVHSDEQVYYVFNGEKVIGPLFRKEIKTIE